MRGHLDLIAAAKRKKTKAHQNSDPQVSRKHCSVSVQSSSAKIQEKSKSMILGEAGEASYGLTENPKQSWKHSGLERENPCRESGKRFLSVTALADHQRSHSRKGYEEEYHLCKKCRKVFDSIRALYGHMKINSKRSRLWREESVESLSDMENQCPVRKKRSAIRYEITVNSPFPGLNESQSVAFELEKAAVCLMMLSRGVTSWNEFVSASGFFKNGTLIFERETIYCKQEISSSDDKNNVSCKIDASESLLVNGNEKNAASQVCVDWYDSIDEFKRLKQDEACLEAQAWQ